MAKKEESKHVSKYKISIFITANTFAYLSYPFQGKIVLPKSYFALAATPLYM